MADQQYPVRLDISQPGGVRALPPRAEDSTGFDLRRALLSALPAVTSTFPMFSNAAAVGAGMHSSGGEMPPAKVVPPSPAIAQAAEMAAAPAVHDARGTQAAMLDNYLKHAPSFSLRELGAITGMLPAPTMRTGKDVATQLAIAGGNEWFNAALQNAMKIQDPVEQAKAQMDAYEKRNQLFKDLAGAKDSIADLVEAGKK